MTRRRRDGKIRWPKWLHEYEVWHPLHSTGYDVYGAEAFAREARRYRAGRALLATAYADLGRFEDASLRQRDRVAAGERAAEQFADAAELARERRAEQLGRVFGDRAVAGVVLNDRPTGALVAVRFPRTILDRELAQHCGARPLGKARALMFEDRRLAGRFVVVTIGFEGRSARVVAFVPRARFARGMLVGADWVERTGAKIVAGELTFPRGRRRVSQRRRRP
jgi:hypothetical protein